MSRIKHIAFALTASATVVTAHDGVVGDHFKVGYYNGHDGTYEAPANPAWPDTLLVDTHPWELDGVFWVVEPTAGGLLGNGWISDIPGFDGLTPADEEFGGHGFFSFIDTPVRVALELVSADAGIQVLRNDLTPMMLGEQITLGSGAFHGHPFYWIPESSGAQRGDFFDLTFRVVDETSQMEPSEVFNVRLVLGPGCPADLTAPYAVIDLADISAFVTAFVDGDNAADFAAPQGVLDLADISAFVTAFVAGCP